MAKLGEARLGSTQFAQPAPVVTEAPEVRERAEDVMKHSFPTESGTTWDAFLDTILFEFEIISDEIQKLIDGRTVDSATMYQLNMLGEFLNVQRRESEGDDHFRARIKLQLPRHTTTTTNDFIRSVCAQLIGTDKRRFQMVESHTPRLPDWWFDDDATEQQRQDFLDDFDDEPSEPARFDIYVEDIVMSDAPLSVGELEALVQDVKAAGVRAFVTIGQQFAHRGVEVDEETGDHMIDPVDNDTAYGGYDDSTIDGYDRSTDHPLQATIDTENHATAEYDDSLGGPYADEITTQFT